MTRFSEAQLARARLAGEPRQRASFALQDVAEWSRYQEQWYLLVTDEQLPEADRAAKWKAATRQWSKMNAQGLNDAQFLPASEPVVARQGGAARADRELSIGAADPACSCAAAAMPPQVLVMEAALYGANGEQVGSSELQMGVGRWEQVGPLHWASHKVHGVGGDGRMHLWRWDEHSLDGHILRGSYERR